MEKGHVGAKGYRYEVPEPRQTLYTWSEFPAEEQVKPRH